MTPNVFRAKYFESSDVIEVKKKSFLNVYQLSLFLHSNTRVKKWLAAEHLDVQIEQTRVLI